jgi:hypothetical protein
MSNLFRRIGSLGNRRIPKTIVTVSTAESEKESSDVWLCAEAYTGIRTEITQIFSSFRQLMLGEYAVYPILLAALLQAGTVRGALIFSTLQAALIVVVVSLGRSWFLQGVRQASYLLVAFELPALSKDPMGNRAAYWILANRSFAKFLNARGRSTYHTPTRELRYFFLQQVALGFVACLAALSVIFFNLDKDDFIWRSKLGVLAFLSMIPPFLATGYAIYETTVNNTINRDITSAWIDYMKGREKADSQYLDEIGFL